MANPDTGTSQFDPSAPYYASAPKTDEQPTQPQFDPNAEYSAAPPVGPTTAWQKFKDRLFEPVKQEEIEKIPGLQPDEVETLKEQGLAAGQPTLRKIFGKEQGDAIRQHIMFGVEPEVFARGALKTLTDWYSPAQLAMSVPGRIAHGYAAAAEAAEHAGLLERANQLAGKARLAGAIGTVSGIPFVAKQVQGLIDNWDGMSPTERASGLAGILGGGILTGVGTHEALSAQKVMSRISAEQPKSIESVNPEYPTRVYNGTAADVNSIEDLDAKYSLPKAVAGPGVYLTRDPQVASEYVKNSPGSKVLGGSLHNKTTLLDAQKELPEAILKEENLPPNTTYLSYLNRLREEAGGLEEAIPEIKNFQRTLADHGFHGVDNVFGDRDVITVFGNDVLPPGQRYNDLVKSGIPAKGGDFVAEAPGGREVPNTGELFAGNEGSAGREPEEKGPEGIIKQPELRGEKPEATQGPKNLSIPLKVLPRGHTIPTVLHHEYGHILEADRVGFQPREIYSHLHPDAEGSAATAQIDFTSLPRDKNGAVSMAVAAPVFAKKFLPMYLAGGVMNGIMDGIPLGENHGLAGDIESIQDGLKEIGFTPKQQKDIIRKTVEDMRNRLTNDPALDLIKRYAATREEGLPNTHHASVEKIKQFLKDVKEARRGTEYETGIGGGSQESFANVNQASESRRAATGAEENLRGSDRRTLQRVTPDVSAGAAFLAGGGPKKPTPPAPAKQNLPSGAKALAGKSSVDILGTIDDAADEFGIPRGLFQTQARQESRLNPKAVSPKGAQGVMQLMPRVSKDLGVKDPFDYQENIRAGAKLMRDLHHRFGYWDRALAAYDWQPDRVRDAIDLYGPAWLEHTPKETQDYVRKILKRKP